MIKAVTAVGLLVRVTGVVQVVLGLLFWSNRSFSLVPAHMAIGLAFVLGLLTLAALGARARIGTGMVLTGALGGIVVLVLGMTQRMLLPGPAHWVIRLLHLLVGIAAMHLGRVIAARTTKRLSTRPGTRYHPSPGSEGALSSS